jgi:hypothetical protein
MSRTHGGAGLGMRREDDKATASREVVENSEDHGVFDVAEGLKEALEFVTKDHESVTIVDNGRPTV